MSGSGPVPGLPPGPQASTSPKGVLGVSARCPQDTAISPPPGLSRTTRTCVLHAWRIIAVTWGNAPLNWGFPMVGVDGLEPPTSSL